MYQTNADQISDSVQREQGIEELKSCCDDHSYSESAYRKVAAFYRALRADCDRDSIYKGQEKQHYLGYKSNVSRYSFVISSVFIEPEHQRSEKVYYQRCYYKRKQDDARIEKRSAEGALILEIRYNISRPQQYRSHHYRKEYHCICI